jgi:hypothetical protein
MFHDRQHLHLYKQGENQLNGAKKLSLEPAHKAMAPSLDNPHAEPVVLVFLQDRIVVPIRRVSPAHPQTSTCLRKLLCSLPSRFFPFITFRLSQTARQNHCIIHKRVSLSADKICPGELCEKNLRREDRTDVVVGGEIWIVPRTDVQDGHGSHLSRRSYQSAGTENIGTYTHSP